MSHEFRQLLSLLQNEKIKTEIRTASSRPLMDGEIRVQSQWTGINYKDALGVTGQGAIFKKHPIVGGIDVAGKVIESQNSSFSEGDSVTVTGCGLGESMDGGYSEQVIVPGDIAIPLSKLSAREAMIYGTAGFTAALAYARMIQNGQTPNKGPILVTGASGGVGQFAVHMMSKKSFEVWAVSGKKQAHDRLKSLGAERVLTPDEMPISERPLDKGILGGVIDNVGGKTLEGLIPHVSLWGNVCSVGLASGHRLNTTVMPFILRGVSLLGTSSNNCTWDLRKQIWEWLSEDLKPDDLDSFVAETVGLDQVTVKSQDLLDRKVTGRILVKI